MINVSYIFIGLLGTLGGVVNKAFRRFAIAPIITLWLLTKLQSLWLLTILSLIGVCSIGYGTPDKDDKGSFLGKIGYKLAKGKKPLMDIYTRLMIGLLEVLSLSSILFCHKNYILFVTGSLVILVANGYFAWKDLGTFKWQGIKLNYSEFIKWGLFFLGVRIMFWR